MQSSLKLQSFLIFLYVELSGKLFSVEISCAGFAALIVDRIIFCEMLSASS